MRDVLPNLKPIFTIKEPVQAVVGLLDNLGVFKEKCNDSVFRDGKLNVSLTCHSHLEADDGLGRSNRGYAIGVSCIRER